MKPCIIMGAGGHALVVSELILSCGGEIAGIYADTAKQTVISGCEVRGESEFRGNPDEYEISIAIGDNSIRRQVYERFKRAGFTFATWVHPSAVVSESAEVGLGTIIMPQVVIQGRSGIGCNSIINSGAIVEHDCEISDHVHIAPGAKLCGSVNVGDAAHVGAGSTVIQGITILQNSIVGAGAVVINNVDSGKTVAGCPARIINEGK